jgi:hypothetical protein
MKKNSKKNKPGWATFKPGTSPHSSVFMLQRW